MKLSDFAGLVHAPYIAQRITDLAQSGTRAQRIPEREK